ncbi:MAG: Undecaprenyl-phosphate alpha-N-acetylglucosaminyl 1-phosphate transferase [Alphaproteobacteria bacterium MarineAlpha5_Bin11]|nr:undecaprenyl-phosphate alpha-N-acetylglucosaminyl 1-phosphate transferase [Pelagibacteraceae bacterium]PPR44706.1 MAG: Undecaprenyl-phosphate alpha-N-acetylglucosaminyl 1-phosphate transferase [Alphaproteobacteria bacterium MarineAlpha5_Bin11]|tara:strand:+ start:12323 stop:13342 length:1020 start_codon:yes stop_codon:yes gene_type:complete
MSIIVILDIVLLIFLIIFLSYFSSNLRLIDYPNDRKIHKGKIPLVGGIAIYISIIFAILFLEVHNWLIILVFSSSVIVLFGALDDALQLGVSVRLISQFIAALVIVGSGLSIVDIGDYALINPIELGMFAILLTFLSVIGLTNAINFMDGIDGLASSLVFISILSIYIFSIFDGGLTDGDFLILLLFNILVFFLINIGWTPIRKIFLGDSGSTMLGFIVAWLLIYYAHPNIRSLHPVLTIWCVTIPVFDMITVTIRRLSNKSNPFKPDRNHIHHILLDKGFSSKNVLFIIVIFACSLNIIGGFIYFWQGPFPALITYFLCFFLYFATNTLMQKKFISNN